MNRFISHSHCWVGGPAVFVLFYFIDQNIPSCSWPERHTVRASIMVTKMLARYYVYERVGERGKRTTHQTPAQRGRRALCSTSRRNDSMLLAAGRSALRAMCHHCYIAVNDVPRWRQPAQLLTLLLSYSWPERKGPPSKE